MFKVGFCRFTNSKLLNFRFQRMDIYKYFEQETSLDNRKSYESEGLPPVYVMSRIKDLPAAIQYFSNGNCPGLSISEINVPADTNIIDPSCFEIKNAEIVVCDPVILGCNYKNMKKLKWAHSTWAGVEPLFECIKEKPHFIVTKHSHADFSEQIAEYVMTHVLIIEKNYRSMWAAQSKKSWSDMKAISDCSSNRLLKELTLGVLGVGNMGQAIAKFFKPHGMKVVGFGRTPRKSSEFGYFDSIEVSLSNVLSASDYIVNTLPSTPDTIGLLDGDALQKCMKTPAFINVGRGSIIQESTLLTALKKCWLSHIVLDVFQEEPLPSESMLWNSEHVTITPHCAAISLPKNIAKDFLSSFLCYQQKKPLENLVDWDKGY